MTFIYTILLNKYFYITYKFLLQKIQMQEEGIIKIAQYSLYHNKIDNIPSE